MWQMTTLYPATFFSPVTFKSSDHFPRTLTKAFSRRTPLINKAHYSTLSGILPMLKCTAFQNKVNTMLGDPGLMINRNPVNIPICPQRYLTFLVCVLVAQLCPTLCNSMDYSPPGSSVHGILQARIPQWVAILQGLFPTQGLNLDLLHCRKILYHLSHQRGQTFW